MEVHSGSCHRLKFWEISAICLEMVHYRDIIIHTRTHPFNGPLSGNTRVGLYQKGKTILDFTEARDSECQRHLLGHMQVCTSL